MRFKTAAEFATSDAALPKGVAGILLCDSSLHAMASARRLVRQGVDLLVVVGAELPDDPGCEVMTVDEYATDLTAPDLLTTLIRRLPGHWVIWLWNGEFFVFPFGENREIGDLTDFLTDERRRGLYCYNLDLYAHDLPGPQQAPELSDLNIDRIGYHAFPRDNQQLRVYGGLGWRFQELLPDHLRQIGRTSLFLSQPELRMGGEFFIEDNEIASVSCPWHRNPTGAIMSLRRARRIMAHPEFPPLRERLFWQGTTRFEWTSAQLLDLGLIEPGQWF